MHQRAAACYENAGQWDDALDHALDAQEFSVAARLLTANADEYFRQNQLDILHKWLVRFPQEWRMEKLAPLVARLEQALHPVASISSIHPQAHPLVSSHTQW